MKTLTKFSFLLLLPFLTGFLCAPDPPPPPPPPPTPVVTVSTDKSVYAEGESIRITVRIENTSDEEIKEAYQICSCVAYKMDGDRYPKNTVCCMAVGWKSLAAHSFIEKTKTHTNYLAPGRHTIVGVFAPYESSPLTIEVKVTPLPPTCIDSDGGINYNVAGDISGVDSSRTPVSSRDYCYCINQDGSQSSNLNDVYPCPHGSSDHLLEYYCGNDGAINGVQYSCPSGVCKNGACSSAPLPPSPPPPPPPPPSAVCGNGNVETGEQCDDGNTRDDDGCSSTCQLQNIPASTFDWSINIHPENLYEYTDDWSKPTISEAIIYVKDLGIKYVRIDAPWKDVQPNEGSLTDNNWDYGKLSKLNTMLNYIKGQGIEPVVVLSRIPDWAKNHYQYGQKDLYWQEWRRFCKKVALVNATNVRYYQLANEANLGWFGVDIIDASDDYRQFTECRAGIAEFDTNGFETVVNVHADSWWWEDYLEDWLDYAGSSIDIIGIDHYPGSHYFNDGTDWYPVDRLFYYMSAYSKKGAIAETGYTSSYNPFNLLATEDDQKNWINTAIPVIKNKMSGRNLVFANYYELFDGNSNGFNPEDHYGIISTNGLVLKKGYSALKNQIRGRNVTSGMSAFNVFTPPDLPPLEISSVTGDDCRDQIPQDSIGNPCNHNDCADWSQRDGTGDPCNHNDCPDRSAQDGIGDACNHNDCADRSLRDSVGDPCVHNDCSDRTLQDTIGDPCVHNDCSDKSLQDGVGDSCNHNDCADRSLRDSVGDPCVHNDCSDKSLQDGVGDSCNHNDCADRSLRDSVGDPCNHNDCADKSLQDLIGDPCIHNDCSDRSLQDNIGDSCSHNDCSDRSPQDGIGDPCDHNDCNDKTKRDVIGDPCNHDEDKDGKLDSADACPFDAYHDPVGNPCVHDEDGDGTTDTNDAFPFDPAESVDTDQDGTGNNADTDDDNDGYIDMVELADGTNPLDRSSKPADSDFDFNPNRSDPIVTVYTDKDFYVLGEVIKITVKAENPYDDPIVLNFNDGCQTSYMIDQWEPKLVCIQILTSVKIEPHQYKEWSMYHKYSDFPLALGAHEVKGFIYELRSGDTIFRKREISEAKAFYVEGDNDGDKIPNTPDSDDDNDGYSDETELREGTNPLDSTSIPSDNDHDFMPDSADPDDDNDGHPDISDAFPFNPDEWIDSDGDGIGDNSDVCPNDSNHDLTGDPCNHNDCSDKTLRDEVGDPCVHNDCSDKSLQDGVGDSCNHNDCSDRTPRDSIGNPCNHDEDGDGVPDTADTCPNDPNDPIGDPCNHDEDKDYVPDAADACPFDAYHDPVGNPCVHDEDKDGAVDTNDAFPFDPSETVDTDGDGIGNNSDSDDDNDGYSDTVEAGEGTDSLSRASVPADNDKDFVPDSTDADDDNDGVDDVVDAFPFDPAETVDTDGDGVGNNADTDDDNDGYGDKVELAEGTDLLYKSSTPADNDRDFVPDSTDNDDDNDGIDDSRDAFPFDKDEWADVDNDGIGDNADEDSWYEGFESGDLVKWDYYEGSYGINEEAAHYQNLGFGVGNGREGSTIIRKYLPVPANYLVLSLWMDINQLDEILVTPLGAWGPDLSALGGSLVIKQAEGPQVAYASTMAEHEVERDQWLNVKLIWDVVSGRFEFFEGNWLILSTAEAIQNELISGFELSIGPNTAAYLDDLSYYADFDNDDDGIDNFDDADDDNDGIADLEDAFALTAAEWVDTDGDGIGNNADSDDDNDGVLDGDDTFPLDVHEWADFDKDGAGDNADDNDDNDGVVDGEDAFQFSISEWADTDDDGIGNNADPDDDNDGVADVEDEFPPDVSEWSDADRDGIGDNADQDDDNDGLSDEIEVDAGLNPVDADSDDDGMADGSEPEPLEDTDDDGLINAADPDSDDDGVPDGVEMGVTYSRLPLPFGERARGEGKSAVAVSSNPAVVIFDQDPSTITDPLNPDTDGGGLLDGEEDKNFNGKVDPGESNPLDVSDDTLPTFFVGGRGGCNVIKSNQGVELKYIVLLLLTFAIPILILAVSAILFRRSNPPSPPFSARGGSAFGGNKGGLGGFLPAFLIVACGLLYSTHLSAQDTNVRGYNLQYFRPTTDGSGTLNVAGSGVLAHLQPHLGLYTNLSRGLLAAGNPVNNQTIDIVDTFLTGDFVFGLGLWNFMDVGVDIPVFFFERGRDFNTTNIFDTTSVGDIRSDLKFRLLNFPSPSMGEGKGGGGLAILSSLYLPTGETSKFTGSRNVEYEGKLVVDKKFEHLYLTANVGYKTTPRQTAVNVDHDDELTFGAGAAVPLSFLDRLLELVAEVYGSTVVRDIKELTTPVEVLGGIRKRFTNGIALTLASGAGLTSGAGSPQYRVLTGITYTFGNIPSPPRGEGQGEGGTKLSQVVYFDFDSSDIKPLFAKVLDELTEEFRKGTVPFQKGDCPLSIKITGHADSTGPAEYNTNLSEQRAMSVKEYLIQKGLAAIRMIIEFFGEEKPTATNETREGRALNRRVEIREIR